MAAKKILEGQRSGKYSRKTACSGYGLGSILLLACSAAMVVFCFMFVDMKSLYDSTDLGEFILQRDTLIIRSSSSLARYESEEDTEIIMDMDTAEVAAANPSVEADNASLQPADGAQESASNVNNIVPDSKVGNHSNHLYSSW